ncbi:M56 family metallopeptidase [Coralliovum pocilloporae]|uniref:M56 family metallopeptidase n=1 Tax=Coralliovum pocilloporae TaxID=3066369 RepID=UPI0033078CBF
MIQSDAVLDFYINANILLVIAFSAWLLIRFALHRTSLSQAFTFQLQVLNGMVWALLLSPVFVLLFGLLPTSYSLNLSDFLVSQYLNGGFEMKPSEFEGLMGMREQLTTQMLDGQTILSQLVALALASGFTLYVIRLGISAARLRSLIACSYHWRRFGNLHLRISDKTIVPFSTRSLGSRYVVIPTDMLTRPHDLKIALEHEFQHFRQNDIEWEIATELLRPFFFWNPVFYIWKNQIEHLRELACDQQVLARGHFDVKAYCDCLLRVCDASVSGNRKMVSMPRVALVQIDRSALLRRRILSLFTASKKPLPRHVGGLVILPAILLVAASAIAIQKPADWSQDRLMLSSIVNLERLEYRNRFGSPYP